MVSFLNLYILGLAFSLCLLFLFFFPKAFSAASFPAPKELKFVATQIVQQPDLSNDRIAVDNLVLTETELTVFQSASYSCNLLYTCN